MKRSFVFTHLFARLFIIIYTIVLALNLFGLSFYYSQLQPSGISFLLTQKWVITENLKFYLTAICYISVNIAILLWYHSHLKLGECNKDLPRIAFVMRRIGLSVSTMLLLGAVAGWIFWRFADGKCEEQILLGTIVNNADRDEVKNSIHIQQIRISILLAFSLANFVFWLIYPGKFEKRGKCC